MKNKIGIVMVFIALLLMLSSQVCAAPPDMSQWVGKWFSVKTTQKGTGFDTSVSKFYKDSGSESAYMNIWNWDPIKQEFQFDFCQFDKDDGQWSIENLKFDFLAGTNVKFLWLYDGRDKDGGNEGTVFTALMEGKEKNGMLQSANIKTLGGAFVDIYDDDTKVSAGTFTITGKMIASSKVPVDCQHSSANDFVGTWKGSITVEGKTLSTMLTLNSTLSGSYIATGSNGTDAHNISGSVSNSILSFKLPVSDLGAGNPDCVNWDVNCSATLSENSLSMFLSCSGTVCSRDGGQPGSIEDILNKQ